jgi:hypothetical protein
LDSVDFEFEKLCQEKLNDLKSSLAMILVLHSMQQTLRSYDMAERLEKGQVICDGCPLDVFTLFSCGRDSIQAKGLDPHVKRQAIRTATNILADGTGKAVNALRSVGSSIVINIGPPGGVKRNMEDSEPPVHLLSGQRLPESLLEPAHFEKRKIADVS